MTKKSPIKTIPLAVIIFTLFFTACSKSPLKEPIKPSTLNSSAINVKASTTGIGTSPWIYNLNDTRDLVTPLDFYSSGHASQIICYRPGTGAFWILGNNGIPTSLNFNAIVHGNGIGTSPNIYNLNDNRDRVFAYDLNGTGKLDHIVAYRPGTGAFWIFSISNPSGSFSINEFFKSSAGVGGFDLSDSRDIIVPFDFYNTGKSTQLLCYRPGTGICWIVNNTAAVGQPPTYSYVYKTSTGITGNGSRTYDLSDNRDLILPYDLGNTGRADGIVCYRPGTGTVWTFNHSGTGGFTLTNTSSNGIQSIGGTYPTARYDLSSNTDRLIPYDYYSNNTTDNIVAYRPGSKVCYMFAPFGGQGYCQYLSSIGIGFSPHNYDLSSTNDKVFAYDCFGTGKIDHLVCYRPGLSAIWIFDNALHQIY